MTTPDGVDLAEKAVVSIKTTAFSCIRANILIETPKGVQIHV